MSLPGRPSGPGVGDRAGGRSGFGFDQAVDAIALESAHLAQVVAGSDLERRVPSCPEWSVRDLAHHFGTVQWSWSQTVRERNATQRPGGDAVPAPGDRDLLAWLGWCSYSLLSALREAGPESPCWTWWGEPRSSAAVGRHQAQEASVHRWDAQLAEGATTPLSADLAGDGVPEFIEIMVGADATAITGTVTLTAVDTGASWQVGSGADARAAELRATASDLVLMLYRRLPVPDAAVLGDPMLVAAFLSLADTR
jgi:uncharacterized protein (TIGR03083 family)